jgi:prolipoprotein diacylglyceryltransferase
MSDHKHDSEPGWFERRENQNKLFYGLLTVAGILTASEFLYEHHPHFDIENIPEFFELFGFVAFVAIVFAGRLLRTVIMRDEDYYDRR